MSLFPNWVSNFDPICIPVWSGLSSPRSLPPSQLLQMSSGSTMLSRERAIRTAASPVNTSAIAIKYTPPFKLLINIHEAENLSDLGLGSVDPYVAIQIDGRVVGKTAVMQQTTYPVWEEGFDVPLLHNYSKLYLKVFHFNYSLVDKKSDALEINKNDILLGCITIDLMNMMLNETKQYKYPLELPKGMASRERGCMSYTIHLFKNDAIIRIKKYGEMPGNPNPNPNPNNESANTVNISSSLDVSSFLKSPDSFLKSPLSDRGDISSNNLNYLEDLLDSIETSDIVRSTIRQSAFVADPELANHIDVVKDLLYDIYEMTQKHESFSGKHKGSLQLQPPAQLRSPKVQLFHRPMLSCTLIDLANGHFRPAPKEPTIDNGLRLVLDDSSPMLRFSTRYLSWQWVKWLSLAYNYWNNNVTQSRLPCWASRVDYKMSSGLSLTTASGVHTGRCTIDLEKYFEISIESVETRKTIRVGLRSMKAMVLSADAAPHSSPFVLQVEIEAVRLAEDARQLLLTRARKEYEEQEAAADSGVTYDNIYGKDKGKKSSGKGGDSKRRTSLEVLSGILRRRSGGSEMLSRSQLSTKKKYKDDKTSTFAIVRSDKVFYKTKHIVGSFDETQGLLFKESIFVDIQCDPHYNLPELGAAQLRATNIDKFVEIYFYHGLIGHEALVGQQKIPIMQLLGDHVVQEMQEKLGLQPMLFAPKPLNIDTSGAGEPSTMRGLGNEDHGGSAHSIDVPLNSLFGVQMLLLSGSGFPPEHASPGNKMHVRCRFVKWNGDDRGKKFKELRSPAVRACFDPDWGGHCFLLNAADGIEWAHFVRLEIVLYNKSTGADESAGAVFVPLADFDDNFEDRTYSVRHFRNTIAAARETTPPSGFGLGELTVRIRFMTDSVESALRVTAKLNATLHHCNEYSAMWPADCIPAGCLEKDDHNVESFCLTSELNGLLLDYPTNKNLFETDFFNNIDDATDKQSVSSAATSNVSQSALSLASLASDLAKPPTHSSSGTTYSHDQDPPEDDDYPQEEEVEEEVEGDKYHMSLDNSQGLDGCIEVHVFQNERRQAYPPFEWAATGLSATFSSDRANFSDETGKHESHFEPVSSGGAEDDPPAGYLWATSEWMIDTGFTQTDSDGWSYASDFSSLTANLKKGESISSGFGKVVRRRKWTRVVRSIGAATPLKSNAARLQEDLDSLQISISSPADMSDTSLLLELDDTIPPGSIPMERCIAVEVFENERRNPYPPFEWGMGNLFSYERGHFSDETGSHKSTIVPIKNCKPPNGYKWVGDWQVDKEYTSTDDNGWCYGMDFGYIMSGFRTGKSSSSSLGRAVRRRKWIRLVFPRDPHDKEATAPKAPVLNRMEALAANRDAILHLCKERSLYDSSILIPWDQVSSVDVITDTILVVSVTVSRYFGRIKDADEYRPADIEIFITNCRSAEMKAIIDERKALQSVRRNVKELIAQGTLGHEEQVNGGRLSLGIPETKELSVGSETIAILDSDAQALEERALELTALFDENRLSRDTEFLASVAAERMIIVRRAARLRLYVAALLGEGLEGYHSFGETEVAELMGRDFVSAQRIDHGDDVLTANNRIEFLLDTAEMRIRDSALCGWSHQGGVLERCLEMFVNGFFIEMVGLLAKFFEGHARQQMQGMQSKMLLIQSFLKHNDRLDTLLDTALRPYMMVADPRPHLSLFLDFNTLLQWYSTVLREEMEGCVRKATSVWLDATKDPSGQAGMYRYSLPWAPLRKDGRAGAFQSLLPEDVASYLTNYLQIARFSEENIAASFRRSLSIFDSKVCLSFASSFSHLCSAYWGVLDGRDWIQASASLDEVQQFDQLDEHVIFLSSVGNDARRIVETSLLLVFDKDTGESMIFDDDSAELAMIVDRIHSTFLQICTCAMDEISCVIFKILASSQEAAGSTSSSGAISSMASFYTGGKKASGNRWRLFEADFYSDWEQYAALANSSASVARDKSIFGQFLSDFQAFLQSRSDYLEPFCYYKLLHICADKIVILYFHLMKTAHARGRTFLRYGAEVEQMASDVAMIKEAFSQAADTPETVQYADALLSKFKRLDQAVALIKCDSASIEFPNLLKSIFKIAQGNPQDAAALARLTEVCYTLRADHRELWPSGRGPVGVGAAKGRRKSRRWSITGAVSGGGSNNKDVEDDRGDSSKMCRLYIEEMLDTYEPPGAGDEMGGARLELAAVSAEWKVFAGDGELSGHDLEVLLLRSAKHASRSREAPVADRAGFGLIDSKRRKSLSNLLGMGSRDKGRESELEAPDAAPASVLPHAQKQQPQGASARKGGSGTAITVCDLRLTNLFTLDGLGRTPKAYIKCFVGEQLAFKTEVRSGSANPSWGGAGFAIVVPDEAQFEDIVFQLCYKGLVYGDDKVGDLRIPVELITDQPGGAGIVNEAFMLDFSESAKALEKVEQQLAANKELPRLILSCEINK